MIFRLMKRIEWDLAEVGVGNRRFAQGQPPYVICDGGYTQVQAYGPFVAAAALRHLFVC